MTGAAAAAAAAEEDKQLQLFPVDLSYSHTIIITSSATKHQQTISIEHIINIACQPAIYRLNYIFPSSLRLSYFFPSSIRLDHANSDIENSLRPLTHFFSSVSCHASVVSPHLVMSSGANSLFYPPSPARPAGSFDDPNSMSHRVGSQPQLGSSAGGFARYQFQEQPPADGTGVRHSI